MSKVRVIRVREASVFTGEVVKVKVKVKGTERDLNRCEA